MSAPGGWDDKAVEIAKALYLEGYSHGEISRALAKEGYSFSRNAVIGKMNRLGVGDGRSIIQRKTGEPKAKRVPTQRVTRVFNPAKSLPKSPTIEGTIQYIGPIETTPAWGFCQYTRDDISRPGWQMCGHPAQVKGEGRNRAQTPWCEDHGRICHQPQQSKRRGEDAA